MQLDFYLSEMAISDGHGGGLSLQRVLGKDLDEIKFFVHVSRFATDHPAANRLRTRCLDLVTPLETDAIRRKIGCRPASWFSQRRMLRVWQAKRVARAISARFAREKRPLKALVCPQSAESLFAIEALNRLRPVEYISWVMDDHLVRWRNGAWQYPHGIEALFARHLKEAKRVFVISPAMAEFYRQRFGVDSQVLFGPTDVRECPPEATGTTQPEIRLGYFGAVEPWQLDALALLADGLCAAGAVLDIYSGRSSLPHELQHHGVSLKGRIPADNVLRTMRTYDAVVLPISFRQELRHMSEFNIATKMSECLASGTITLVIGPPYAAMVRFLQPAGVASMLTNVPFANLPEQLKNLKKIEYRRSVLERARRLIPVELSTAVMRQRWTDALVALNGGGEGSSRSDFRQPLSCTGT
jgi:glycosyltransferase involved in cell wall biosynthesis